MGGQWELFVQGVDRLLKWQQEMGSIVSLLFVLFALFKLRSPYTYILAAVMLARDLLVLWSGGEVMGHHRFMAPAIPAYWLLFQAGLWAWLGRVSSSHRLTHYAKYVIPLILLFALGAITVSHLPKYQRYAEGLSRAHIRLGRWLIRTHPLKRELPSATLELSRTTRDATPSTSWGSTTRISRTCLVGWVGESIQTTSYLKNLTLSSC